MIAVLLSVLAAYFACGLAFAIPFTLVAAKRIDPHAGNGTWGFRTIIVPGTMFLWPLLARRLLSGRPNPPEEKSSHRCAARS
jgi:hypothetical protein